MKEMKEIWVRRPLWRKLIRLGSKEVDASDIARKLAYTAKNDLAQVKDIVSGGTKKIAQLASDFFAEMSDRYN